MIKIVFKISFKTPVIKTTNLLVENCEIDFMYY